MIIAKHTFSVLLLDTEAQTNNFYITLGIRDALRAHPRIGKVVLATHADAIHRMQTEKFDLFLAFGGPVRHHVLLRRLCGLSGTSVLWTTEDPYESLGNIAFSDCFDLVFTNDRSSLGRYDGRAAHLPLAASPSFQNFPVRTDDSDYRYDMLFVGTAWPNRVKTVNSILKAFPQSLKVKIALPWNRYIPKPDLIRPEIPYDWRCSNEDFARFANMSRVVLTLTRAFSGSATEHASGTTPPPRLFEVALAGGAQVVVGADPEISDYYHDGNEIRTCCDEERVVDVINSLLSDAPARIAMAERARARTLEDHTYAHRIDNILTAVDARRIALPAVALVAAKARPRVLFVAHNRAGQRQSGGVEFYQEQLAQSLMSYDVVFMYPSEDGDMSVLRIDDDGYERTIVIRQSDRRLADTDIEGHFQRLLSEHRIDLVHFQHLLGLPLSLPLIARAYGVATVFHIHDFHLICHRFNLLNHQGQFCDVVHRGSQQCDSCLLTSENIPIGAKARRNGFVARMLMSVDAFIASTPFSADYFKAFYPEALNKRFEIIEMIDFYASPHSIAAVGEDCRQEKNLRIAVLGNVVNHKGAQTLLELIRVTQGQGYIYEIFGYIEIYLIDAFHALSGESVRIRGGYAQEEVAELLRGCDVSLHLSIWPETYMISLTEAWRVGVVPIVTDLGAQGERVTDGVDGLKIPPGDASAVLQAIRRLRYDADLLDRLRGNIAIKRFPTVLGHSNSVAALYDDLLRTRAIPHTDFANRSVPFSLTTFDLGIRLNFPEWASAANLWDPAIEASALQEATIFEDLPTTADTLVIDLPPHETSLSWEIDELFVDDQRLDRRTNNPAVTTVLALRGWMWWSGSEAQDGDLYLRLRSTTGSPFYVRANRDRRPVLADRFSHAHAADAGFAAAFRVQDLPARAYQVDLVSLLPDRIVTASDVMRFTVTGVDAFHVERGTWRIPEEARTWSSDMAPVGVAVERHSLQNVAGVAVARPGSHFRLDLRVAALDPRLIVVGLQKENRVWWLDTEATRDASGEWALVEAHVEGLEPGLHALVIQRKPNASDDREEYQSVGFLIYVAAASHTYLLTEALPENLQLPLDKKKTARLHIDLVATECSARIFNGQPSVRVAGWCFAPGLGRPLYAVAYWRHGRGRRFMIVEMLPRQDVAVHLANSEAVNTGFDLDLPLRAIQSKAVKLFLVYKHATVACSKFDSAVSARLKGIPVDNSIRPTGGPLISSIFDRFEFGTSIKRYMQTQIARRSPVLQSQRDTIVISGLFRADWYARQRRVVGDPIIDYLLYGANLRLNPHPLFDTGWYVEKYPDVASSGMNPLIHYIDHGGKEFRDPSPLFASKWYSEQNLEIINSKINPLIYYVTIGATRDDITIPYFDKIYYRETYGPAIPIKGEFTHYIEQGVLEGYMPSPFYCLKHVDEKSSFSEEGRLLFQHRSHVEPSSALISIGEDAAGSAGLAGIRVAVVAHVYYLDLWPQIVTALENIPISFDLYITCPEDRAREVEVIAWRSFPQARVIITTNVGRDIGPFLRALQHVDTAGPYTAICKIHTKRGTTEPVTWRHVLFDSVLGSEQLVTDILCAFRDRPKLGIVGSRDLYFSGPMLSSMIGENIQTITAKLYGDIRIPETWGFFAGSMFWIRPDVLHPLQLYAERDLDFETDSSRSDGQTAHALERVFGLAVTLTEGEIGLVDSVPELPVAHALTMHPAPAVPREERPEIYLVRKRWSLSSQKQRPKKAQRKDRIR